MSAVNIAPLAGRLLLTPDPAPEKIGNIFVRVPEYTGTGVETGIVVAVNEEEVTIRVGDRVVYPADRGSPIDHEGHAYLGMLREDLIGILR